MSAERTDGLRDLYYQVLDFLQSCGGAYQEIKLYQACRLWECLNEGLYLCRRDQAGKILQFVAYWRIHEDELPAARHFLRPADPCEGNILFTVDYATSEGIGKVLQMFQTMLAAREPGAELLCYEHQGRFVTFERTGKPKRPWKLRR